MLQARQSMSEKQKNRMAETEVEKGEACKRRQGNDLNEQNYACVDFIT